MDAVVAVKWFLALIIPVSGGATLAVDPEAWTDPALARRELERQMDEKELEHGFVVEADSPEEAARVIADVVGTKEARSITEAEALAAMRRCDG